MGKSYKLKPRRTSSKTEIEYTHRLNDEQYAAVSYCEGPQLIAAGAGTGKTRTMVYKVAWLVEHGTPADKIVLLTFTRRAAQEMKDRASKILDHRCQAVQGGTFHSFANQVLRKYCHHLGFNKSFSIIDSSESGDVFQHLRTQAGLHKKDRRFARKDTLAKIHSRKQNTGLLVEEILTQDYPQYYADAQEINLLFEAYKAFKKKQHLMDYDDLLLHLRDLLYIDVARQEITKSIDYLIIDEYQDTNKVQNEIACLLSSRTQRIAVVGDDFQSIYSFRGASHQNMLDFPKILPSTKVFYLQGNYRSTQKILNLSNELMAGVELGYEKTLKGRLLGESVPILLPLPDIYNQAAFVTQRILELREEGIPLDQIAVLFRSAFHSNELEVDLGEANIPFVKFGGIRFAEAAHVKDVLAYLKVAQNPRDFLSWQRILLLLEGLGPASIEKIIEQIDIGLPDLTAINLQVFQKKKFYTPLLSLVQLIATISQKSSDPFACLEDALHYYTPILQSKYENFNKRQKDLESLEQLSVRYQSLEELLSEISLDPPQVSEDEDIDEEKDEEKLTLSTIHSSKGLEFHTVFVLSVVEGAIPSAWAQKTEEIEEERRLLYVAFTRAKENLYIIQPEEFNNSKTHYAGVDFVEPSRFLEDMDNLENLVETWTLESEEDHSEAQQTPDISGIKDFFN